MGRLTFNVLLSFAQFEREVTGGRIRDKIAASKKKILCGWTATRLGRLSFHTSMEATDAFNHLRDRCRDHRPRE